MSAPRTTRRAVLTGGGLALAGVALPSLGSGDRPELPLDDAGALVVLQDPHLPLPIDVQRQLGRHGTRIVSLEADPVRMWRGAAAPLLAAPATRLLGVTSWPNFLLVRGLAEESGRRVRYQRLDSGGGAMVWLIA